MNQGMGHAWDDEGVLYVASFGSRDVRRFAPDGTFLDVFTDLNLSGPVNLWFGESGDLFVQDWQTGSIERFDGETGFFIDTFISGMTRTEGFAFGEDGLLYLADWQQNVINRYDASTGAFVDTFIDGADAGLAQPNSLVFMPTSPVPNEPSPASSPVKMGQSYPNPTLDSAVIPYALNAGAEVTLKVFDVVGREVATLVEGFRPVGTYAATVEPGSLPAGLYVYRLIVDDHVESRRLAIMQ